MTTNIAKNWKLLSGAENWDNLLDPLDIDLRQYLIHYGERAQATYDTFNSEKASKFAGSSIYSKKNLFSNVGLDVANPYKYNPTKYLYATSKTGVSEAFVLRPSAPDVWSKESNWIGYVAVATDEGKKALGRRDILIAWRGTITTIEWLGDVDFPLVSASSIFGDDPDTPKVHKGWLSLYTSNNEQSPYTKTSAREQVLSEVKQLVRQYQEEEISITITGHSLGAALGALNAADIAVNVFNKPEDQPENLCPVTAFLFASPRVGDSNFKKKILSKNNLHILRVKNSLDIVPYLPIRIGYTEVGQELKIETQNSNYLKDRVKLGDWHNLEEYLHGIAGTQGTAGGFHLEVKRDIALVNKSSDAVKDEYSIPASWWSLKNKGMVQLNDGSWKLEDHEIDDVNSTLCSPSFHT